MENLALCSVCHQALQPEYYFCPNCGHEVHEKPLSTTAFTQSWIYAFSIILPLICFIMVTKWPAIKYIRSQDLKARQIGWIAVALITLSTCVTIWLAYAATQEAIRVTTASLNQDMGGE